MQADARNLRINRQRNRASYERCQGGKFRWSVDVYDFSKIKSNKP